MTFRRSFFFALLLAGAISALAAENQSSPAQPAVRAGTQDAFTRGPYARQFLARAGLLSPQQEETRFDFKDPWIPGANPFDNGGCNSTRTYIDLRHPGLPAAVRPFGERGCNPGVDLGRFWAPGPAVSSGDLCYTMRTYKVKRTERLGAGESATRGYSTCELASNFQVRALRAVEEISGAKARLEQK